MAAPAATDADIEEGAEAKKGIPKLFIIIGAAVIVVLLGGAGLFFFMSSGKTEDASADHAAAAGDHAAADGHGGTVEAAHTFIFNLPPMVINLNNEVDGPAFMKLTVALEVANEEMMLEIQPRLVKVIDAFQVYLRELRKSDLEGSAGIYRLKEELLRRVNVAIYPSRVESLLFKELLVQ